MDATKFKKFKFTSPGLEIKSFVLEERHAKIWPWIAVCCVEFILVTTLSKLRKVPFLALSVTAFVCV